MANIDFNVAFQAGRETEIAVYNNYKEQYDVIHQDEKEVFPTPDEFKNRQGYEYTKAPDLFFRNIEEHGAYFEVKNSPKMFKRPDLEWYYLMGLYSGLPVYIITRGEPEWIVIDVMYLCRNILPNVEWREAEPQNRLYSKYILTEDYLEITKMFKPFHELFTC
tara:strand:- start:53 stop:541 length:489 start_codon:yes stop_codon:yes gene_type:complete